MGKLFVITELVVLALFILPILWTAIAPFLLILALPLGLQFLLVRMMGFRETQTRPGTLTTPTHYHVSLDLPTWNSGLTAASANSVRMIYSHQSWAAAIDFAEELRYYLGMQPE